MSKSKFLNWSIWFIASIFYAYQYVIRVLPNLIMPEIMEKFQIEASLFGQFSGVYYLGYTIVHLPLGLLLDRMGPKVVLPVCMALTGLGLLPIILADSWVYPIIGRIIIGIGSSAAILGVFKVVRMCFVEEKFTIMLGLSVTIGLLGAIYGGQPVNLLLQKFGWQEVLKIMAVTGFVLAAISYFIIPSNKSGDVSDDSVGAWDDIKRVLSNPMVIFVCMLGGLMVGPLEGFADAWGTEFFKAVNNFPDDIASSLPSFVFLGMCFGAPFLSYLAAKTNMYNQIVMLCAVLMALGFAGLIIFDLSPFVLSVILSYVGVLGGYQILVIYKASTYVPKNLISLTTAFANMIIMTFGYFFHTVIGKTMDILWGGQLDQGIRVYSESTFKISMSIIPITLAIAAIGFVFVIMIDKRKRSV